MGAHTKDDGSHLPLSIHADYSESCGTAACRTSSHPAVSTCKRDCYRERAVDESIRLPYLGQYLTSTLLSTLSTMRRCGGRRAPSCARGGGTHSSSPPPPPPPTRITQSLQLKTTSHYTGLYKEVVEVGWGISIVIYAASDPGWISGVSMTSSASHTCNVNWCGIEVLFRATVPSGIRHHAESLSSSAFCRGVALAQDAVGFGSAIRVPNETDVTLLTTHVNTQEAPIDWGMIAFGIIFGVILLLCLAVPIGAALGH